MDKKNLTITILLIAVVGGGYFLFSSLNQNSQKNVQDNLQANLQNSVQEQEQEINSVSYEIQGMKIETLKEGSGEPSKTDDLVTVHYEGTLEDGTKFDSSVTRGVPFSFTLGENRVIQGWELGVLGMKVGEKRKLIIPSELGYGTAGAGDIIPPNATLVFEVELLKIN